MEQSLMRIADVMQCPLHYQDGKVSGSASFPYTALPGLNMKVPITAKKVFHSEQTGVLFHIMGCLWALVGHYEKTNATTLFLIDGGKIEADGVIIPPDMLLSKQNTLKESVDALRPGIVKSYLWRDTAWTKIALPK